MANDTSRKGCVAVIRTSLSVRVHRKLTSLPPRQVLTVLQEEVKSGGYYNNFATLNNAPLGASDDKVGVELWEWTTEELKPFL